MSMAQSLKKFPEATEMRPRPTIRPSDDFDLRDLGRKLWRRKAIILGTIVLLTTFGLLVIFQLTPRFVADAYVMINPRETQVVDVEAVLSGLSADSETIESEIQVIRSRGLAQKTVERLQLDQDPEFNYSLRPPSEWSKLLDWRYYLSEEQLKAVEEWRVAIFGARQPISLSEEEQARREMARIVNVFLSKLEVLPQGRSRVIVISFSSENPRTAASAANTLADFYIVAQLEAKFEATKRATSWLDDRLAALREQVQTSERAVEEFRESIGGLTGGGNSTLVGEEISELNRQYLAARTETASIVARLQRIEQQLAAGGVDSASEVLRSPIVQALRQQEVGLEGRMAELSSEYGNLHPKMVNLRAEIRDLRQKIEIEVKKVVEQLRNEVAVARAREATMRSSLNKLKGEVAELNTYDVQLRALEREANANRTLFETFLGRFKETSSQEDFQQADAQIISHAEVPEWPAFPDKRLLLVLCVLGAAMIGVLLAFAVELLDQGFRSMQQVEELTGMTPLGLVPALKGLGSLGKSPETYIMEKPASAFGEAIRSLHTNLLLSDVDKPPKIILIASSLPGEGKTSVVLSLARLLSRVGQKVVVVDCDLRRPSAHKAFGIPSRPGIVECLVGEASVEEVIHRDEESGAYILPAGAPAPNPPDLLASDHMKKLLGALSKSYDLVVIDSAPVLAVSDTRILSRMADKSVFLVRWAETRQEMAITGLRQLVDAGADVAGVLLTLVDVKKHAGYGYGDSGYYHGRLKKYYTGS